MRLSRRQFDELLAQALADVPAPFAEHLANVVIGVEPYPSEQTVRELGLDDADDLLGLYTGTPMTERHADDGGNLPDSIVLYQRNIEEACDSEEDVVREIRTTLLHEIGHYFGMDETELDDLGYG